MLKYLVVGVALPFEEEAFAKQLEHLMPILGLEKITLAHIGSDPHKAAHAREPLEKHARALKKLLNIDVTSEVTSGLPAEELNLMTDELKADGILLLFHNHSKTYEVFMGSVALNMARSTRHPLILLTGQADAVSGSLLLASDGSQSVRAAENLFNQLVPQAKQGVVINVQTNKDQPEHDQAIDNLKAKYAENDQVEVIRAQGEPVTEILQSARYHAVDLVIFGKRGQNPLKQLMFGSTAERLCREVKRPVLIVPNC